MAVGLPHEKPRRIVVSSAPQPQTKLDPAILTFALQFLKPWWYGKMMEDVGNCFMSHPYHIIEPLYKSSHRTAAFPPETPDARLHHMEWPAGFRSSAASGSAKPQVKQLNSKPWRLEISHRITQKNNKNHSGLW